MALNFLVKMENRSGIFLKEIKINVLTTKK